MGITLCMKFFLLSSFHAVQGGGDILFKLPRSHFKQKIYHVLWHPYSHRHENIRSQMEFVQPLMTIDKCFTELCFLEHQVGILCFQTPVNSHDPKKPLQKV